MIEYIIKLLIIVVIAYLIGSIPTGYIAVKLIKKIDIRKVGSGSTGATNVKRVLGTKWFYIVMLIDALKGFIPVFFVSHIWSFESFYDLDSGKYYNIPEGLAPVLVALSVLIGHSKSVFLGFTGGKSVATGVGTMLALSLPVGIITAVVWGIVTFFTKYVSLGSIIAISLTPILMMYLENKDSYIIFAGICAIYVIIRHKDNFKRLIEGKESKVRK